MKITEKQQKRIAEIIRSHTSWTVGWHIGEEEKTKMYADCAASIARYLERSNRQRRE